MEWWHYLIVVVVWLVIIGGMGASAAEVDNPKDSKQDFYRNGILTFIFLLLLLITFKYLFIE